MEVEGIVALVAIVLHWRVLLPTVCAAAIAVSLAHLLPWFSAVQGIALTCVACGGGIIWHSSVWHPNVPGVKPTEPTKASAFCVAAILLGLLWGGASSSTWHAAAVGVVPLPVLAWVWLRYAGRQPQISGTGYPLLCVILATSAYILAVVVGVVA